MLLALGTPPVSTGDGWEPLCTALGVPVPDEPFPHTNTAADFRRSMELESEQSSG